MDTRLNKSCGSYQEIPQLAMAPVYCWQVDGRAASGCGEVQTNDSDMANGVFAFMDGNVPRRRFSIFRL